MPKRPKSPSPARDEPKYLIADHPYPLRPNWERPEDRIEFSRWAAAVVGKDVVFTFFHKPSSRNFVLFTIPHQFADERKLLGEHRWGEILQRPTKEEETKVTRVYFSKYSNASQVKKDGWKPVDIKEEWFAGWTPTKTFRSPYPLSCRCDTPPENPISEPLCRPLPVKYFPPPRVERPPPPGSAIWNDAKNAASGNSRSRRKKKGGQGAWDKGAPALTISASGSGSGSQATRATPSPSPISAPRTGAWGNGASGMPAMSPPSSASPAPPGLVHPSASSSQAQTSAYASTTHAWGTIGPLPTVDALTDGAPDGVVHVALAPPMDEDTFSTADEMAEIFMDMHLAPPPADGVEELAEDDPAREYMPKFAQEAPREPEIIINCPVHGGVNLCKRQICTEHGKLYKAEQRRREQEKQAKDGGGAAKENYGGRGRGSGRGRASFDSGRGRGRGPPPQRSGPGGWGANPKPPPRAGGWGTNTKPPLTTPGRNPSPAASNGNRSAGDGAWQTASVANTANGNGWGQPRRRGGDEGWQTGSVVNTDDGNGWGVPPGGSSDNDWGAVSDGVGSEAGTEEAVDDGWTTAVKKKGARERSRRGSGSSQATSASGWGVMSESNPWGA